MKIKTKIKTIIRKLNEFYPLFKPRTAHDPLDELILTMLSQNTNDNLSFEAFRRLKERFKSWDEVAKAPLKTIENTIRIGGLAPTKSKRLKSILKIIAERNIRNNEFKNGSPYHLDFLKKIEMDEAYRFLTSIKGIGEKTASCVLVFSLNKPAFPIDTHVYRILSRQGIIPPKMPVSKAHAYMLELVEPDDRYRFHLNLIAYGREICHARKPECQRCIIKKTCLYFNSSENHTPNRHST